jgi:hypothetical protein
MNEELRRRTSERVAPVEPSAHTDLQFVSLQFEGRVYGGWYRPLPDGRMELLALANIRSELRPEKSLVEQARGMLADFVRAARMDQGDAADAQITTSLDAEQHHDESAILGDLRNALAAFSADERRLGLERLRQEINAGVGD